MSPLALLSMITILALVWGGFGALLFRAIRAEGRKRGHAARTGGS